MTLIALVINVHGAWVCCDRRLTGGRASRDDGTKFVNFTCDDGKVAMAYAGVGLIENVAIDAWIRENARGYRMTVEEAVQAVTDFANRDLGPRLQRAVPHVFLFAGFRADGPVAATVTNRDPDGVVRAAEFHIRWEPNPGHGLFLLDGSGAPTAARLRGKQLERIKTRRPAAPSDYIRLLQDLVEDVAQKEPSVSASSTCVYLPPDQASPRYQTRGFTRSARVGEMPSTLHLALDVQALAEGFHQLATAGTSLRENPELFEQLVRAAATPRQTLFDNKEGPAPTITSHFGVAKRIVPD